MHNSASVEHVAGGYNPQPLETPSHQAFIGPESRHIPPCSPTIGDPLSLPETKPYVLEITATATMRLLVHAEDYQTADDILDGRFDELKATLAATAGLPDPDAAQGDALAAHQAGYIHFDGEVRHAFHGEVVGPEALHPDIPTFDHCDHEEHYS